MNNVNDISAELNSLGSSLAGLSRKMPYAVPDGYFGQLTHSLQQTVISATGEEEAPGFSKSMPYGVPVGYFNNLTESLVATAKAANTMPFAVPGGYFESLPAQVLQAAKESEPVKKETKFIPLKRQKVINPIRWAAAAILIVTIGVGSYEGYYSRQAGNPENMLSSVNNTDIQDYVQHTYRVDAARIADNNVINNIPVDNKEIIQYLDETGWDAAE